jgi:hypothetical protein
MATVISFSFSFSTIRPFYAYPLDFLYFNYFKLKCSERDKPLTINAALLKCY